MKKDVEEKAPINAEYTTAESSYRREVMVTTAQPLIKKLFFGVWIFIDLVLILVFILSLAYYLGFGISLENRQISRIGNNIAVQNAVSVSRQAEELDIDTSRILSLGEGKYDYLVEITNPNSDWYAEFDYYFSSSSGETEVRQGYVMPSETKAITSLNQASSTRPSNPDLEIQNLTWRRVNHHEIEDLNLWLTDHDSFEVADAMYGFDIELDDTSIARSSFNITNNSPYSYWSPSFTVTLQRGGTVVGVTQVVVNSFESSETRAVNVSWFDGAPTSGTVVVEPNINFFDETVYLDVMSDLEVDVRDRFE